MNQLELFRKEIDVIDENIIKLLTARYKICKQVAIYKKKQNIPMMQPGRIKSMMNRLVIIARDNNISEKAIQGIFSAIINYSCELEDQVMQE
jgi:chorismate mutase